MATQFGCGFSKDVSAPGARTIGAIEYSAVDINTATAEELDKLPHIGPKNARAIIEYRSRNGPFKRVEHLMLIDGISDKRFREIRHLITVNGGIRKPE